MIYFSFDCISGALSLIAYAPVVVIGLQVLYKFCDKKHLTKKGECLQSY